MLFGDNPFLKRLFFQALFYENLLSCKRIRARMVHQTRKGRRGRCKNLYLLRCQFQPGFRKSLQRRHVAFVASRVGGNEIVGQVLALAALFGKPVEGALETDKMLQFLFAH